MNIYKLFGLFFTYVACTSLHAMNEDGVRLMARVVTQCPEVLLQHGVNERIVSHFKEAMSSDHTHALFVTDDSNFILLQGHSAEQKQSVDYMAVAARYLPHIRFREHPKLWGLVVEVGEKDLPQIPLAFSRAESITSLTIKGTAVPALAGEYRGEACTQLKARLRLLQAALVDHEDLAVARKAEPEANFESNSAAREWCKSVRGEIELSQ